MNTVAIVVAVVLSLALAVRLGLDGHPERGCHHESTNRRARSVVRTRNYDLYHKADGPAGPDVEGVTLPPELDARAGRPSSTI